MATTWAPERRRTSSPFRRPWLLPLACGMGVTKSRDAAAVHYARINGHRDEKLAALDAGIRTAQDIAWSDCPDGWQAPFLPRTAGNYWSWPLLSGPFPVAALRRSAETYLAGRRDTRGSASPMVPACRHCRHWIARPQCDKPTPAWCLSRARTSYGRDSPRNFAMLRRAPHPSTGALWLPKS